MKVLIAEDDTDLRQSLEKWFTSWGHDVVVAGSAAEAVAVLNSRNEPELALLDCEMPGFDTLGAVRQLSRRPDLVATYLLVFTASKQKPLTVQLLRAGGGDCLRERFDGRDFGLRLEIGKASIELHRQRWCPESACVAQDERAN
jgi:CheY-like chemotaxis protein